MRNTSDLGGYTSDLGVNTSDPSPVSFHQFEADTTWLTEQANVTVSIDDFVNLAHHSSTTYPSWRHSVDRHLGRKNRLKGGFFICESMSCGRSAQ